MSGYKDKWWSNITEMIKEMNGEFKPDKAHIDWKIDSHDSQVMASFYDQWFVYLNPIPTIFSYLVIFPESLAKLFYVFSRAVEGAFEGVFRLFGVFDFLANDNSYVGKVYNWLRILGLTLFTLFVVIRVVMSFVTTPFKYKEFFNNLILVSFATAFLPQTLSAFARVISTDSQVLQDTSVTANQGSSSLSIQPFQSNVTDLNVLIENKFDTKKLGRTPDDDGYINPPAGFALNSLDDKNVLKTNFGQFYGVFEEKVLTGFKDKAKDAGNPYYGMAAILSSELKSNEYDDNGKLKNVQIIGHKAGSIPNPLKPAYLRFKVNWMSLFVQQVMLFFMLIGTLINLIMSIIRVGLTSVIAPIVGYTSVESSTKFIELLQSIFTGMSGAWFEVLIIKYGMWFIAIAPKISFAGSGTLYTGMSFGSRTVMNIALYVAVFLATSQGSKSIENWLGISTGAQKGLFGLGGLGYASSRVARSGVNTAKGLKNATIGSRGADGKYKGGWALRAPGNAIKSSAAVVSSAAGFASKSGAKVAGSLAGAGRAIGTAGFKAPVNYVANQASQFGRYVGGAARRNIAQPFRNSSDRSFYKGTRNSLTGSTYRQGKKNTLDADKRVRSVASGNYTFNKQGSQQRQRVSKNDRKSIKQGPAVRAVGGQKIPDRRDVGLPKRADQLPRDVKVKQRSGLPRPQKSQTRPKSQSPRPSTVKTPTPEAPPPKKLDNPTVVMDVPPKQEKKAVLGSKGLKRGDDL